MRLISPRRVLGKEWLPESATETNLAHYDRERKGRADALFARDRREVSRHTGNQTPVKSRKLYLAAEKDKLNDLDTRFFVDRAGWDNDVVRKLKELETAAASLEIREKSKATSR